jgi:hypothetical protein
MAVHHSPLFQSGLFLARLSIHVRQDVPDAGRLTTINSLSIGKGRAIPYHLSLFAALHQACRS